MTLEQTLMGRSQEREPVQVILVVDFDAFVQTGSWITCDDQTDQHTVHIYLVAIRCSSTAEAPAVGKAGVDCRIQRNYIARETVGDGNWPVQVDRLDDVYARTFEGRYRGVGNAQSFVDSQRIGVAHQHREQDVGAEVSNVQKRTAVEIEGLTLYPHQACVEQGQRVAANLHELAAPSEARDDVAGVHGLGLLTTDSAPDP